MLKQHSPIKNQQSRGFTLIELLVVVAIIAVLISILVPSLQKARQMAGMVRCSGNLRPLLMGLQVYFADSENQRPLCGTYTNSPKGWELLWPVALSPYVGIAGVADKPLSEDTAGRHYSFISKVFDNGPARRSVLFCPSERSQWTASGAYPTDSSYTWAGRSSYAAVWTWNKPYNGYVMYDSQIFMAGSNNFTCNSTAQARYQFSKDFAESPRPGNVAVFGHTGATGPYLCANGVSPISNGAWRYSFFSQTLGHGGTLPFGWLDAHVSFHSKEELLDDFVSHGGDPIPGQYTPAGVHVGARYGPNGSQPLYGYGWVSGASVYSFLPW